MARGIKLNTKAKHEMKFIGQAVYSMEDLMKTNMSILKKTIENKQDQSLEKRMNEFNMGSKLVLRYEEIEQTNEFISMTMKCFEFEGRSLIFKLSRNRSLGETIEVYTSEKKKNGKEGAVFKELDLPIKEIVRNDLDRQMRMEVLVLKKRGAPQLLGECDFSIM